MNVKHFFFGLLFLMSSVAQAQNNSRDILFTIDQNSYNTEEFSRIYRKNLDLVKDESQKDLDQYLQLFIGYKLKVNKAYKLGLQNSEQYQNELKSYRSQLAKNYFNDTKITQELVEEGYKRLQKEIRASHILITVAEDATAEDTLIAYKKVQDIRKKAMTGEDFGNLASQFSEDPSAKDNQGDLGYFTAFRMIYAFESAAFNTSKGEISKIIRTRFGYHILKVVDVRANRGELTVAHIMFLNPKPEDADQNKAKNTAKDIYLKLQQGEKFEDLAKQFSEDKSSSPQGGVLNKFGSGQLSSEEFENAAFALLNPNEISKPIQSKFGWHIIKLIEKHPVRTIDEMRNELEAKIGKDDRSKKYVTSLQEKLRKKYSYKRDAKQFELLSKLVTNDIYEGKWVLPANAKDFKSKFLTINGSKNINGNSFLEFVDKKQATDLKTKPLTKLVEAIYEEYVDEQLKLYYDENLEKDFPEFANVIEEYRDGLLLFDLMQKEIWERAKTDTIGLQQFYEQHKLEHMWKNRVDITVLSSTKKEMTAQALDLLQKNIELSKIKETLNVNNVINIMTNSGVFEEGSSAIPKATKLRLGISDVFKEGEYYFVTKVDKVLPAGVKTLEECKGKIVNDYQQYLEERWVDDLKKEFSIKINNDVFTRVKKQLHP